MIFPYFKVTANLSMTFRKSNHCCKVASVSLINADSPKGNFLILPMAVSFNDLPRFIATLCVYLQNYVIDNRLNLSHPIQSFCSHKLCLRKQLSYTIVLQLFVQPIGIISFDHNHHHLGRGHTYCNLYLFLPCINSIFCFFRWNLAVSRFQNIYF